MSSSLGVEQIQLFTVAFNFCRDKSVLNKVYTNPVKYHKQIGQSLYFGLYLLLLQKTVCFQSKRERGDKILKSQVYFSHFHTRSPPHQLNKQSEVQMSHKLNSSDTLFYKIQSLHLYRLLLVKLIQSFPEPWRLVTVGRPRYPVDSPGTVRLEQNKIQH